MFPMKEEEGNLPGFFAATYATLIAMGLSLAAAGGLVTKATTGSDQEAQRAFAALVAFMSAYVVANIAYEVSNLRAQIDKICKENQLRLSDDLKDALIKGLENTSKVKATSTKPGR